MAKNYVTKKFKGTLVKAWCYARGEGGFTAIIDCKATTPGKVKKEAEQYVYDNFNGAKLIDIVEATPFEETRGMTRDEFYVNSYPIDEETGEPIPDGEENVISMVFDGSETAG